MDANPITQRDEEITLAWARKCKTNDQEDIAQEIRIAWVAALSKWEGRSSRRTYLNAVARRVVYQQWRFDHRQSRARVRMAAHRMIHDGDLADLLRNLPDSVHEYRLALARGSRREQNLDSRSQDTLAIMTQPQREVLMVIMHTRSLRAAARQLNISHVALIGRLATIRKRLFTDPYQFQRGGNQRNGERMSCEPKERAMWCPVCGNEVKEAVNGQFCSEACKRDSINYHHEAAIRADREYDQYVADGLDRLLDDEREEGTDDEEEEDQDNDE